MSKLYHGLMVHNGWIRRGYACPYCTRGSKPIHEALMKLSDKDIEARLEKKFNKDLENKKRNIYNKDKDI